MVIHANLDKFRLHLKGAQTCGKISRGRAGRGREISLKNQAGRAGPGRARPGDQKNLVGLGLTAARVIWVSYGADTPYLVPRFTQLLFFVGIPHGFS